MKTTTLLSVVTAVTVGAASASVTLNFSAPPFDFSGGFVGSGGEASGLVYGVIIDTGADGFASFDPGIALTSGSLITGGGNDLLWLAGGVTGAAPAPGGVVGNVAGIPIGANAGGSGLTTAPGQAFALVWFDPTFTAGNPTPAGGLYGQLEDAGFLLPPDGTTGGGYNTLPVFDGNPARPANIAIIPEPGALALGLIGFLGLLRRRR